MAEIKHSLTLTRGGVRIVSWKGLGQNDTADEVILPEFSEKSVHVFGTFGASAAVSMQGSNDPDLDGTDFEILKDLQDGDLTFSADGLEQVQESVYRIKPTIADGDGDTDIDVHLLVKRPS